MSHIFPKFGFFFKGFHVLGLLIIILERDNVATDGAKIQPRNAGRWQGSIGAVEGKNKNEWGLG